MCFFTSVYPFFSYFITDPFFPLSFLVNSWFPGMLDDLFQSLFLCALLLFWLCVYHGIRVQVGVQRYLVITGKTVLVCSVLSKSNQCKTNFKEKKWHCNGKVPCDKQLKWFEVK